MEESIKCSFLYVRMLRPVMMVLFLLWASISMSADLGKDISQLVINEIQVSNLDMYIDPSGNYGAWIEIYNPTDSGFILRNCYVSDDPTNLQKCRIHNILLLPSKGFVTIPFDHCTDEFPNQVSFDLDADGGEIFFSEKAGVSCISASYPPAITRTSWARITDGGDEWQYTDQPSKGKSNRTSSFAAERLPAPVVSRQSCLFTTAFSFNVDVPQGATLRYTTDGTVPTYNNGMVSTDGHFTVNQTVNYRFRLFRKGYLAGPVTTCSFIRTTNKYTLPVVSITTDPRFLYDDSIGIKVQGVNGRIGIMETETYNWNMDWDRVVNFEYILPDGSVPVNQETLMSIVGGWSSRRQTPQPFQIRANKACEGLNSLDYEFLPSKPHVRHKAIRFRSGGNDISCRFMDAALQTIIQSSGIDVDGLGYQPVVHYINGQYAGLINLREPSNKHYVRTNHGFDDDEIDVFKLGNGSGKSFAIYGYNQLNGTKDALDQLRVYTKQCSNDKIYEKVCSMLDIDEYINYMATHLYLGVTDWFAFPNNGKGWKYRGEDGRFRLVQFDMDTAFDTTNGFSFYSSYMNVFNVTEGKYCEHDWINIFLDLCANSQFRRRFIDTYCLVAGSVFDPDRVTAIVDSLCANVAGMMAYENRSPNGSANRIKGKITSTYAPTLLASLRAYVPLKASGLVAQQVSFSANISEARLFLNDIPVPTNRFRGTLFAPAKLRVLAPDGYRFKGWYERTASNGVGRRLWTLPLYPLPAGQNVNLVACFEEIKPEDDGRPALCINEVSSSNDIFVSDYWKIADWVEIYNTTSVPLDIAGYTLQAYSYPFVAGDIAEKSFSITSVSDVNTIVEPHGHLIVWCDGKESVTALHAPFKLSNDTTVLVLASPSSGDMAVPSDTLLYIPQSRHQTVGRFPDGSSDCYLLTRPTIGASNWLTYYSMPYDEQNLTDACGMGDGLVVEDEDSSSPIIIYDLMGRRIPFDPIQSSLQDLEPGVYIINNKKTYIQ